MNKYKFDGPVCTLTVMRKGEPFVFIFDSEDYPRVAPHKWRVVKHKNGPPYLQCDILRGSGVKFHRLIMSFQWPIIDHKNGNTLDNRKENLRGATPEQNSANCIPKRNRGLPVGVYRRGKKFFAIFVHKRKMKNLGYFHTPEEAEAKRREKSIEVFGEFSPYHSRAF